MVGAGIEYLVGLLARLFCASTFAVENPGYPRTAQVLRNNGVRTVFVPVDGDGIDVYKRQQYGFPKPRRIWCSRYAPWWRRWGLPSSCL